MVEKKETLTSANEESEVVDSTREELGGLREKIGPNKHKDKEKFEKLLQNPVFLKAQKKVFDKCINDCFGKDFEKKNNVDVGKTLDNIEKKYPKLLLYIFGNLGLQGELYKFSDLDVDKKLNYIALINAINQKPIPKSEIDIVDRCNRNLRMYQEDINSYLKKKNINNLLVLEKTLKDDFKLNSAEYKCFKDYLLLIKKHPDFLGNQKILQAGMSRGWGILIFIFGVGVGALGHYYIQDWRKPDPETLTQTGIVEITEIESIKKILAAEATFHHEGYIKRQRYKVHEDDPRREEIGKGLGNRAQTSELEAALDGKLGLQYDAEGCWIRVDRNTGEATLYVKRPTVEITNYTTKILYRKGERLQSKRFDNMPTELIEKLKYEAKTTAENGPKYYEMLDESKKSLLSILRDFDPDNYYNVKSLEIVFVGEEGSIERNPEIPPVRMQ